MKRILIGTNNPSKLMVFRDYLKSEDVEILSPAEINLSEVPHESAGTAADNAVEKAKAWHRLSGLPVMTEDSGLVFVDLPKNHPDQPGVMVRRAAGHAMDDDEMLEWYRAIVHRHGGKLRFAWEDAWCILLNEEEYYVHADTPETLAAHAKLLVDLPCTTRLPGWPLDSLTYDPSSGKYKAEMTLQEMHAATDALDAVAKEERSALKKWIHQVISERL